MSTTETHYKTWVKKVPKTVTEYKTETQYETVKET